MDHTEGGDALNSRGKHTGGALEALVKPKPSLSAAKPDTSTKSRKAVDRGVQARGPGECGLSFLMVAVGRSAPMFAQPRLLQRGAGDSLEHRS